MWYVILNDEQYTMLLFETENESLNQCAALGLVWAQGFAKHIAVMDGED